MRKHLVEQVRRFNRVVTQHVGALEESYLDRGRPLGEARLLHEIGREGAEIRALRQRLKLDSGYLSRLLRSLESQGLIETRTEGADGRVRRAVLTAAGEREHARYDTLSDDLAWSMLEPLRPEQRSKLVEAMSQVERLLRAGTVELRLEDPQSQAATWCLESYFAELGARFDRGFDARISNPATVTDMSPPAGYLVLAWSYDAPVGCGVLKLGESCVGEIKRMWTAPEARGLGIARRILDWLEEKARLAKVSRLRLETNGALTEARALYLSQGYREVPAFNDEPYADHWFEKKLSC